MASNNIPKIVLVDKGDYPDVAKQPNNNSGATSGNSRSAKEGTDTSSSSHAPVVMTSTFSDHPPIRSSSDIGLPAASMPNLALELEMISTDGGKISRLGVYCSPRTMRRSVDLDVTSRDVTKAQMADWRDTMGDTSGNSLKVLTASSRVSSALSLNSECTARSIGLLSNDSGSGDEYTDNDVSERSERPAQLRRYMSHPEEGASPEVGTRPSQSLCNLKAANAPRGHDSPRDSDTVSSLDNTFSSMDDPQGLSSFDLDPAGGDIDGLSRSSARKEPSLDSATVSTKTNLPSSTVGSTTTTNTTTSTKTTNPISTPKRMKYRQNSDTTKDRTATAFAPQSVTASLDSKSSTMAKAEVVANSNAARVFTLPGGDGSCSKDQPSEGRVDGGGRGRGRNMLSYKCDTHDSSRDGRIRQWLQDMDSNQGVSNG